jgi:hypothetical protein
MASGTGVRHIRRIYCRERILDRPDIVSAMTTDTGCDLLIFGLEQFPMNAGVIFPLLVNAQPGIESLHHIGVAVASSAKSRDLLRARSADITLLRIHRAHRIVLSCITSVTVDTREAAAPMYVALHQLNRFTERPLELRVTIDAGVLLLGERRSEESDYDRHSKEESGITQAYIGIRLLSVHNTAPIT